MVQKTVAFEPANFYIGVSWYLLWAAFLYVLSYVQERMYVVGTFTLAFACIRVLSGKLEPRVISEESAGKRLLWHNTVVSFLHATAFGVLGFYCALSDLGAAFDTTPPGVPNTLMVAKSPVLFNLVALSCGYFAYDTSDMVMAGMHKSSPHLFVHHGIIMVAFVLALTKDQYLGYPCMGLLCEWNSVFLHFRKILKMLKLGKSGWSVHVYWMCWGLLLLSFVILRLVLHPLMLWQSVDDVANDRYPEPHMGIISCCVLLVLCLLDLQLAVATWRAFKRELKELSSAPAAPAAAGPASLKAE